MRKFLVVVSFLGLVGFLAGCRGSCNPCAEPCAPAARPCPQPCPRPCPRPCASPCNEPNPCAQPPIVPCQGGCSPDSKPCTCALAWGSPSVSVLAEKIKSEAIWHYDNCPPALSAGWARVRDDAIDALTSHATCTKYTCDEWWSIVKACHAAVMALQNQAGAAAPVCTELNHQD